MTELTREEPTGRDVITGISEGMKDDWHVLAEAAKDTPFYPEDLKRGPTQWEYLAITVETWGNDLKPRSEILNEFGRKHWELVAVDNGVAYLKRTKANESERINDYLTNAIKD